jgi:hypothetical protein
MIKYRIFKDLGWRAQDIRCPTKQRAFDTFDEARAWVARRIFILQTYGRLR